MKVQYVPSVLQYTTRIKFIHVDICRVGKIEKSLEILSKSWHNISVELSKFRGKYTKYNSFQPPVLLPSREVPNVLSLNKQPVFLHSRMINVDK